MTSSSQKPQFEVRLSADPCTFSNLAEQVQELLGGTWTAQLDGLDQSYWDLQVGEVLITVHREHYLGVCVFGLATPDSILIEDRIRSYFKVPAQKTQVDKVIK